VSLVKKIRQSIYDVKLQELSIDSKLEITEKSILALDKYENAILANENGAHCYYKKKSLIV
jgi:hypothetical protein